MIRHWQLTALLPVGSLIAAMSAVSVGQDPIETPANRENIEAALKLTLAAAAEYEFRVGKDEKPLELQREPVLRWSNPDRGEVHGNVFVWTRGGRPLAVGSSSEACPLHSIWFRPGQRYHQPLHEAALVAVASGYSENEHDTRRGWTVPFQHSKLSRWRQLSRHKAAARRSSSRK